MTDEDLRGLCLSLLHAESESEVIGILRERQLWEDPHLWRDYGDREDNFSVIGNQQSRPEAALVEKVVNSVDAVLMNGCWLSGIPPDDPAAPRSIHQAVALYFDEDSNSQGVGHIENWDQQKRTEASRLITIASTGPTGSSTTRANPCFTIADAGEGQTPNSMPVTILSLDRKNKLRIQFVQGKFNMGGTGVLQFCGRRNLQLAISRRNPAIVQMGTEDGSEYMWSFTIVRREDPPRGQKNSVYTYLAPVGAPERPRQGELLRFNAESLPIFPLGRDAYARDAAWGTVVKLYEYAATGFRSMMFLKDGLLSRLDILLPEVALPIRLHECRGYGGHAGSFETTVSGLTVRLEDNKAENLEDGFPTTCPLMAQGEPMVARVYAFRRGRADTYRKHEGIVFTVNGQTHAHLPTTFFARKNVAMGRLADSLLVMVDCSEIGGRAREDLFMNSRDRLRNGDLRDAIERELELILQQHQGLKDLRERRRREEVESKIRDSKPLEEALRLILKSSPSLSSLFLTGDVLANPFRTKQVASTEKAYKGKRHPTYFKFQKLHYGKKLERNVPANTRCRITFETDVANDYFYRREDRGTFRLRIVRNGNCQEVDSYSLNLQDGKATLNLRPPDAPLVGDVVDYEAVVTDDTLMDPFVNRFALTIVPAVESHSGTTKSGGPAGTRDGRQRELPIGLTLPEIHEVHQSEWDNRTPTFDRYSALQIVQEGAAESDTGADSNQVIYSFWVNMDNVYFKTEVKSSNDDPGILKARWVYGLTLIGMALIQADVGPEESKNRSVPKRDNEDETETTLEDRVFETTEALAPVLLPLVESLGSLREDQIIAAYRSDGE